MAEAEDEGKAPLLIPFCGRELPLLAPETILDEATWSSAEVSLRDVNERLRREHRQFREAVERPSGQMLQHVHALPLPLTHCTVCWRATNKLAWTRARLALQQSAPPTPLRRIGGAVFSALAGHRPPFCCDAAWCSLDMQESYARYDVAVKVLEAPLNPGCDPGFSYVGGSVRVLPTARLDFYTQCWQVTHGWDSKPLYEMLQATRSLLGMELSLGTLKCCIGGEELDVKASATAYDFSRTFRVLPEDTDVLALMGQLSFSFRSRGAPEAPLPGIALPSRHCILALVNGCRKGSPPSVQGVNAYVARRHDVMTDTPHVLARSGGVLECFLHQESESGRKTRFLMEAHAREASLIFVVSAPFYAAPKKLAGAPALQQRAAGRAAKSPATFRFVPLFSWLHWAAAGRVDDDDARAEAVDFCDRLQRAAGLSLGREIPASFLRSFVDDHVAEEKRFGAYRQEGVKLSSFFACLTAKDLDIGLDMAAELVVKALAVHLFRARPDTLSDTKSLQSAASTWRSAMRSAVLQGLRRALKKALGPAASSSFHVHFGSLHGDLTARDTANARLERACYHALGTPQVQGKHSTVVIDAYAKHYATVPASERQLTTPAHLGAGAKGIYFLLEKSLVEAWRCPMCKTPKSLGDVRSGCQGCGFAYLSCPTAFDLCPVVAWRKQTTGARKAPAASRAEGALAVALLTAAHLADDMVALSLLSGQLRGKKEAKRSRNARAASKKRREEPPLGADVSVSTEDSARGRLARRTKQTAPPLHDDLFASDAGKDSNPDLRLFLRMGSRSQVRPTEVQLEAMKSALRTRLAAVEDPAGAGLLVVRGRPLLRFDPASLMLLLLETRRVVHAEAARVLQPELATCCPVLRYSCSGPVVTLLCSGNELVRPVKWRRGSCLRAEGGASSFAALVYDGWVTYAAPDEHVVLLDGAAFSKLPDGQGDGMTFGLFDELEAAVRMLQLEDASTWPAGHAVRAGFSATLAMNSQKTESLQHSKGQMSGSRSCGHDPHKVNVRSLIGSAPDNHYGSALKLVAVLRDYSSWMQEDSLPESIDSFRHYIFKHQALVVHRRGVMHASATLGQQLQRHLLQHTQRLPPDVAACIDPATGMPRRLPCFFRKGQALCFFEQDDHEQAKLVQAPYDAWVVELQVRRDSSSRFEFKSLSVELAESGQKHGKLYQKFVSVQLDDWLSGGSGRINSLLSSGSLAGRTAAQNVVRSWMTMLALAAGVGALELQESLTPEAALVRGALHASRPLSASALAELRRLAPRASVSNLGPLVAGKRGEFLGQAVQLMMSILAAQQDASRPNGTVNGVEAHDSAGSGYIVLDPIMTLLYNSYGLGQKETTTPLDESGAGMCRSCRKLACACESVGEARQALNVDESFRRSAGLMRCCNVDVSFASATPAAAASAKPEEGHWATVGPTIEPWLTMTDAARGFAAKKLCLEEVRLSGSESLGLAFGASAASAVVADQFIFALRNLKYEAAWLSGDQSRGDTVMASVDRRTMARALSLAAEKILAAVRSLRSCAPLSLSALSASGDGDLAGSCEPGGTLQLQTRTEALKQALIGITCYGNTVKRVWRAFLASPPAPCLRGERKLHAKNACGKPHRGRGHEAVLFAQFERNVLNFLFLATTLETLAVSSCLKDPLGRPRSVRATLPFPEPKVLTLCASDILVDGRQLFAGDIVLGPNPRHRAWQLDFDALELVFIVHEASVAHAPTRWEALASLVVELEAAASASSLLAPRPSETLARVDAAVFSRVPAIVAVNQRPVFVAEVRDAAAFADLKPAVCGYEVFSPGGSDLATASRLYCVGCGDCTTYHRSSETSLQDLEDLHQSSAAYFAKIHRGNRRAIFEGSRRDGKLPRRDAGPPLKITQTSDWCFRAFTNEASCMPPADAARPVEAFVLEEWPSMELLLKGVPPPTFEERSAEESFLKNFVNVHGGQEDWIQRAETVLALLIECGEELAHMLKSLAQSVSELS